MLLGNWDGGMFPGQTKGHCAPQRWPQPQSIPAPRPGPSSPPQGLGGGMAAGQGARAPACRTPSSSPELMG